jgi:hypothetical protein
MTACMQYHANNANTITIINACKIRVSGSTYIPCSNECNTGAQHLPPTLRQTVLGSPARRLRPPAEPEGRSCLGHAGQGREL